MVCFGCKIIRVSIEQKKKKVREVMCVRERIEAHNFLLVSGDIRMREGRVKRRKNSIKMSLKKTLNELRVKVKIPCVETCRGGCNR